MQFKLLKDTPWHKKGTRFVQYDGWKEKNMYRVRNGGKGIEIVHYPADLPDDYLEKEGPENDAYRRQEKQAKLAASERVIS